MGCEQKHQRIGIRGISALSVRRRFFKHDWRSRKFEKNVSAKDRKQSTPSSDSIHKEFRDTERTLDGILRICRRHMTNVSNQKSSLSGGYAPQFSTKDSR
ncbi:hypothetical protein CEXT_323251 [Caerostris extrusa]|uniref:Uncharacterized protein n=1 Tax=Caerostris extrusa TaxID=172846 RepID=A0AAV4VE55_CAEEX|nr:hypothetical protein CEXT_323251 [Caerostris extrusa]